MGPTSPGSEVGASPETTASETLIQSVGEAIPPVEDQLLH